MSWIRRYRLKAFLRSSIAVIPIAFALAAVLLAPLIRSIDERTRWTLLGVGPEGARAVVGALASSLLTFIVFAFSIILLAVQIASTQLTPRIISRVLESRPARLTLGAFLFSYTYTTAALGRIDGRVPQLPVLIAYVSSLVSVVLFLYLIQQTGSSLRAGVILERVAAITDATIVTVYPLPFLPDSKEDLARNYKPAAPVEQTIRHNGPSGTLVAFDVAGLVEVARRVDCTIEMVPQVGDFLATGEDLFLLRGPGAGLVDRESLSRFIALGLEQVIEENPVFGFRILVEIGIKALSPAINDPTTAVLAIDQLHHLLFLLGQRQLDTGFVRDSSGRVRLVYPTPCWEDFVILSATEIRLYGAAQPQITRRLQAMFENLLQVLPAARAGVLQKEMALLRRTIDRSFADPEDRQLARIGDTQGFGGRAA